MTGDKIWAALKAHADTGRGVTLSLNEVLELLAGLDRLQQDSRRMRTALARIAKWFGEFPPTERVWPDGGAVSYGVAYGSNGERDYMREIAHIALIESDINRGLDAAMESPAPEPKDWEKAYGSIPATNIAELMPKLPPDAQEFGAMVEAAAHGLQKVYMSTANQREPVSTATDCRSYEGINVGLIDTIITACRVLSKRDLYGHAVTEALNDMRADRDVLKIVGALKDEDLPELRAE